MKYGVKRFGYKVIMLIALLCMGVGNTRAQGDLLSGKVLSFNGSNNYVEVVQSPQDLSLQPTTGLTVEAWVYRDNWALSDTPTNIYRSIIDKSELGTGGYFLAAKDNNLYAAVGYVGGGYLFASTPKNTLSSGWHHIVATFDTQFLKLYVDSVLKVTKTLPQNANIRYPYKKPLAIGRGRSDQASNFAGRIDEARVYNRAITDTEVAVHYNSGSGQFGSPENGLVAGYHFDEGTGTVANDYSGLNHHGTLYNGPLWVDRTVVSNTISGVSVYNRTPDSAFVSWVTSESSDSRIDYGTSTLYGSVRTDSALVTQHVLYLSGFASATEYHYKITSGGAVSGDLVFSTLYPAPTNNIFFVAPAPVGSSEGNGSEGSPWDLETVLKSSPPVSILPGAQIWLRGGTYPVPMSSGGFNSYLNGTPENPITLESYPGEWAVIDGNLGTRPVQNVTVLRIYGVYTHFKGFEITNSNLEGRISDIPGSNAPEHRGCSIDAYGSGTYLINLVVHDTGQGIGLWGNASNAVAYGNIVYNNGLKAPDRSHGHGFYTQNNEGTRLLKDNIVLQQFGQTMNMYGSSSAEINNFDLEYNVFHHGDQSLGSMGMMTLGGNTPVRNFRFNGNMSYNANINMGYGAPNEDAIITNNYLMSGITMKLFDQVTMTGNEIFNTHSTAKNVSLFPQSNWDPSHLLSDGNVYYKAFQGFPYWHFRIAGTLNGVYDGDFAFNNSIGSQVQTYNYTHKSWQTSIVNGVPVGLGLDQNSTYIDDVPHGTRIFFRPNDYDSAQANVIVFNWDQLTSVSVPEAEVGQVLVPGDHYELRNCFDYFGDRISGTYSGGDLVVPMTGHTVAKPIGYATGLTTTDHFPKFGVFRLVKVSN